MVTLSAVPDESEPVNLRVSDVELIERQTKFLRAMDYRAGRVLFGRRAHADPPDATPAQ
ncbi:hypothetical protein [Kibdelosporangium aridum]|uniref:hypothetical protein n=1 Tax=Kibdelosporangium aridum TaxID=2030 RepID=UPI0035E47EF3